MIRYAHFKRFIFQIRSVALLRRGNDIGKSDSPPSSGDFLKQRRGDNCAHQLHHSSLNWHCKLYKTHTHVSYTRLAFSFWGSSCAPIISVHCTFNDSVFSSRLWRSGEKVVFASFVYSSATCPAQNTLRQADHTSLHKKPHTDQ